MDIEIVGLVVGVGLCTLGAGFRYRQREHHEWRSNDVPLEDIKKKSFVPEKKEFYFSLNEKPACKMLYTKKDFPDYVCMLLLSIIVVAIAYGQNHMFTHTAVFTSIFMAVTFLGRYGTSFEVLPVLVSNPIWSVYNFFHYKITNLRLAFFVQIGLCLTEALLFRTGLLQVSGFYELAANFLMPIDDKLSSMFEVSSGLVMFVEKATFGLFYLHFGLLTVIRSITFLAHLWDQQHVFDFLQETGWRKVLRFLPSSMVDNIPFGKRLDHYVGLTHAFLTGVWTHFTTLIPWYSVLMLANGNVMSQNGKEKDAILCGLLLISWMLRFGLDSWCYRDFEDNDLNDWYIRDHWVGHHDRLEFNYMHGPHHDALPIGMIAVADNGPLEGVVRHYLGHFDSFTSPPLAFFLWTKTVIRDLVGHQYVPGVFPYSFSVVQVGVHHIEHHYLSLYPLGNGIGIDPDPRNNCEVETWISGNRYSADNKVWNWFVGEVAKHESKFYTPPEDKKLETKELNKVEGS